MIVLMLRGYEQAGRGIYAGSGQVIFLPFSSR